MPSSRPQAAFEPIAPNLDLRALVESTPNFEWVTRIRSDMIDHHGLEEFERLVLIHVVLGGKPLVIDGYDKRLDKWTFAVQWLRDNCGEKIVDVRELNKDTNVPMTMDHYLKHMAALANQWTTNNYKEEGRQRMYLKDMDCPQIWHDKLKDHIPLGLFYLNESTGDIDGQGAIDEADPNRPGTRIGRGVAKAGDLMSSLPKEMRAENLMCYVGHEGTYTPSHREMCASLGHNIMVEASKDGMENGKPTKAGTSIWFMTESKEREVVSEYWLSRLGHDIEIEKHFAQLNAWKHAPFKTYVVEQKPGDFILIPPLAPHQVWNRGTRTIKVAWNRTTIETLEMALEEALFKARFVCRDEQYKNKAIIYYTMQKYSKLLRIAEKHQRAGMRSNHSDLKIKQLEKDFKRLHGMYTKLIVSESFDADKPEKQVELIPFDSNITCSYCRCNIFNRFLTCTSCVGRLADGDDDTYDICMECYAMGRSCACISKLKWVEQFEWSHLTQLHDQFRKQIISIEQKVDSRSPKSLKMELNLLHGKRTLAQICQMELLKRPWNDVNKIPEKNAREIDEGAEDEDENQTENNGNGKKTKKKVRRSEKYIREHARCHVDCYWEPKWKQAHCTNCDKNYCYGNLFRAYDMMPQDILADPKWQCPSCQKICGCRNCRNKPGYKQYTPKGTLLGHNTKAVADPRSVESLVDFSHSNIAWIQKAGDDHQENTLRLLRRRKDAELAKSQDPQLGEDYVDGRPESVEERVLQLAEQEGIPIDPALVDATAAPDIDDEDGVIENPEIPRHNLNLQTSEDIGADQWVPEGGIIWDSAHAYDSTDAITYVYPDPGVTLAVQLPPAPSEGYEPVVQGYEQVVAATPGPIEMTNRKRKRPRLDDGDRTFQFKKQAAKPKSSKPRKSLVVKLMIAPQKLAAIEKLTSMSQEVLSQSTGPVIGSDLPALNNGTEIPQIMAPAKVIGGDDVEDGAEDGQDTEFTPSRYRDRRKPATDGLSRPPPDADITRRTTRMQTVTYADPSDGEEEFNETVTQQISSTRSLVTGSPIQESARSPQADSSAHQQSANTNTNGKSHSPGQTRVVPVNNGKQERPKIVSVNDSSGVASPKSTGNNSKFTNQPLSSLRNNIPEVSSRALAEAQANRRAKMAAIEGFDDHVSDPDSDSEKEAEAVLAAAQKPTDQQASAHKGNVTLQAQPVRPVKSTVGSKAPKLSLPAKAPPREPSRISTPAAIQRVAATDWDDSSDEDIPFSKDRISNPSNGFVSVNVGRNNPPLAPSLKKRGRPAMT